MMVKLSNGFLELNEDIEVERKVKLFEDVSLVEGDFSYSFSIPKTQSNVDKIGIFSTNNSDKPWASRISAEILDDSGVMIHTGFIRIENDLPNEYGASFFSGNSNWIAELDFSLLDIDWSEFDVEYFDILDFDKTEGMVFPLVDNGILSERRHAHFSSEDFKGYMYVKSMVNKILTTNGMKLTGSLTNDALYNKLITSAGSNEYLSRELENRESYAGKSSTQVITNSFTKVTFTDVTAPFFNSPLGNWSTTNSRYTFDIEARDYEIELKLKYALGESYYYTQVRVVKNGSDVLLHRYYKTRIINTTFTYDDLLDTPSAGDYYEIFACTAAFSGNRTLVATSSVQFKPTRFFKVFANTVIPDMTCSTFITNVFRMFNMVVKYDPISKTITANNFDRVLSTSDVLDLSQTLSISEDNFEEFVSDYAKNNLLLWGDMSIDQIEEYNQNNIFPYASGVLEVDNEFLEDSGELIEMDFVAPFQQSYPELGIDLPLTNFVSASTSDRRSIASVTVDSSSGIDYAVFNYSGSALSSTIVRISESTIEEYNGDYFAVSIGSVFNGYVEYLGNATAVMEVITVRQESSDPVFLLNNPSQNIADVSGVSEFYVDNLIPRTNIAVANFLATDNYFGSLSFEYLKNLYFNNTEKLLNTGVKALASGDLSVKNYYEIDFMNRIRVNDSLYYVNRHSGYKGSNKNSTLELIKL